MIDPNKKVGLVDGYKATLHGIALVCTLRDVLIHARDGFAQLDIPQDATLYTARIHMWLDRERRRLEKELGLAQEVDQYGEPLDEKEC